MSTGAITSDYFLIYRFITTKNDVLCPDNILALSHAHFLVIWPIYTHLENSLATCNTRPK